MYKKFSREILRENWVVTLWIGLDLLSRVKSGSNMLLSLRVLKQAGDFLISLSQSIK
jgi:hypothetical protein